MKQQEVTKLESGQVITHHSIQDCKGLEDANSYCPLHKPEPGPWASWPRHWDSDKQIVVRECPCGAMHPAQEVYDWSMDRGQAWKLVHQCCKEPMHVCSSRRKVTAEMAKANEEAYQIGQWTLGLLDNRKISLEDMLVASEMAADNRLALVQEALDLVVKLWPSQGEVRMSEETWDRLRRVLLAIPELVTEVEATNE